MRVALGLLLCLALYGRVYASEEIDSEEHGTYAGRRGTSCKCGWANKEAGRIVGGKQARVNELPFIGLLTTKVNGGGLAPFCGGTFISTEFFLTAAHCTYDFQHAQALVVIAGEHDYTLTYDSKHTRAYQVSDIYQHPQYNNYTLKNDISILHIRSGVVFSDYVGPACLPTEHFGRHIGEHVMVAGWGHTRWKGRPSPVLLKTYLRTITAALCRRYYPQHAITDAQFCTYSQGKDSCQGDSGGPVVYLDPETNRYTLAGLVSFGRECAGSDPGVNTEIYSHMPWILGIFRMHGARGCYKV